MKDQFKGSCIHCFGPEMRQNTEVGDMSCGHLKEAERRRGQGHP